jgi:hypothetical protein
MLAWAIAYGAARFVSAMQDIGYSDFCRSHGLSHCPLAPGTSWPFVAALALGAFILICGIVWIVAE